MAPLVLALALSCIRSCRDVEERVRCMEETDSRLRLLRSSVDSLLSSRSGAELRRRRTYGMSSIEVLGFAAYSPGGWRGDGGREVHSLC